MRGGLRWLAPFLGFLLLASSVLALLASGTPSSSAVARILPTTKAAATIRTSVAEGLRGARSTAAGWLAMNPTFVSAPAGDRGGVGRAAAHAASLAASRSGPTPATVEGTAFAGLDSGCGYCAAVPPDVQIAAGGTYLVEMVNLGGGIFTKQGTPVAVFPLYAFPFYFASTDYLSDPQILYDGASGRFFATLTDLTTGGFQLAVSATSDPTGGWWDYNITGLAAGSFADQPMLGVSDNVVAVGANDFSTSGTTFYGGVFWIITKSTLLTGATTYFQWWGPSCGAGCTYDPSINPVRSLSSTPVQYFLSSGVGATSTLTLYTASGIPPATASLTAQSFSVGYITVAPSAPQRGSSNTLDTGDGRVLDAVWQAGSLWATFVDRCTPAGDTQGRSCFRLVDYNTSTSSLVVDQDWGSSGLYYLYPALSLDSLGDMSVIVGYSSSTSYPGLNVWGAGHNAPGTLQTGVNLTGTLPSGPVTDPTCSAVCRYGDYFGAATDPGGSLVWVAGEYGTSGTLWSTYIGSVQTIPTLGVTVASSPASVDLGQRATLTATASLGTAPYSYSWSGLPPGCSNANTASLSCLPTTAGTYGIQVTATDATSASATSAPFSLRVFPDPVVAAPTLSRVTADVGQTVTISATVLGGTGQNTYAWSLPTPCSGTTAALACSPSTAGVYNISVSITDSNGMSSVSPTSQLQVSVVPAVSLSASPSPALQGQSVLITARVTGGLANFTYAWSGLPPGCDGPADKGSFSCNPSSAAAYELNVTVVDHNGLSAVAGLRLTVQPSVLGLPSTEGYSILAGIAAIVVILVALLLARRRRKNPPPPMLVPMQPPFAQAPPPVQPPQPPSTPPDAPLPPSPPPGG